MSDRGGDHTGYASDAFKEQEPNEPFAFSHSEPTLPLGWTFHGILIVSIASRCVHAESEKSHHTESHPVGPVFCLAVSDVDRLHVVFGIPIEKLGSIYQQVISSVRPQPGSHRSTQV